MWSQLCSHVSKWWLAKLFARSNSIQDSESHLRSKYCEEEIISSLKGSNLIDKGCWLVETVSCDSRSRCHLAESKRLKLESRTNQHMISQIVIFPSPLFSSSQRSITFSSTSSLSNSKLGLKEAVLSSYPTKCQDLDPNLPTFSTSFPIKVSLFSAARHFWDERLALWAGMTNIRKSGRREPIMS